MIIGAGWIAFCIIMSYILLLCFIDYEYNKHKNKQMKKLSIGQKAKAYDAALERAEGVIEQNPLMEYLKKGIEYIFPELKESEDEKIRKGIKSILEHYKESGEVVCPYPFVSINEALAWLEKQSEHKRFDYENANIQQKDFAPQKDIPRYHIGDVLCDKSCTTLNKELQSNFKITDIRNGLYICNKCSFPISQQDEYELVVKRIESAWSEKDEENFRDIVGAIHAVAYQTTEDEESRLEWLYDIKQRMGG